MNMEQTRAALAQPLPVGMDKWALRSDWLAEVIISYQQTGKYAYNADIEHIAAEQFGDLTTEEQKRLGTLVYNAQKYAREIVLTRNGFVRATQEVLAPFEGKHVIAVQNGSLSGERMHYVKRDAGGRLVMMLPRSRSRCLAAYADNWVKGFKKEVTPKEFMAAHPEIAAANKQAETA